VKSESASYLIRAALWEEESQFIQIEIFEYIFQNILFIDRDNFLKKR